VVRRKITFKTCYLLDKQLVPSAGHIFASPEKMPHFGAWLQIDGSQTNMLHIATHQTNFFKAATVLPIKQLKN
jgi:hypothetical protein